MIWIFLFMLVGLIPAAIAQRKGRSAFLWWVYGTLLFIVALPHAILMSPSQDGIDEQRLLAGMKRCPFCAEIVRQEAIACRYCGRDFPSIEPDEDSLRQEQLRSEDPQVRELAILVIAGLGAASVNWIPALRYLAEDPDEGVRSRAKWAIEIINRRDQ